MEFNVRLLAAGSFFLTLTAFLVWRLSQRPKCNIKGPKGNPFIGIGLDLPPRATEVFRKWALEYGELFKIRIGWYDWVVINSPQAFREILDKQSISTSSKIPAPIGHDVVTSGMRLFTMSYGAKWRTHRSIMHQLLSPKMTLKFVPTQEFEVKQFLHQLLFDNENQSNFYQHVRRLSFSIVMTSAQGRRVENLDLETGDEASALLGRITRPGAFIEDTLPILGKLPKFLQPSYRKAEGYSKIVHKGKMRAWNRLKDEVKAGTAVPSFGRNLAESDYKAQGLTDLDCAWIVGGLVEAGAEITSVVINNLILYLAATPSAQRAAADELTRVVGSTRAPSFSDMPSLPYVRACVKEILRLCPVPTWAIKHYADADIRYKDYRIPAGTVVLANTTFMHTDPARYDEPGLFRPERFLGYDKPSAEYATMSDPYQRDHFTFGAGRRICPAARLAENTLDITVANLLWAFELLPPLGEGEKVGVVDTSEEAFTKGAFRAPKPFKLRFVPRSEERARIVKEQWEREMARGDEKEVESLSE